MEGISLSVEDKLKITRMLDKLGVDFVEGGWPGSNPKDAEFFERARDLNLENSTVVAFGATRRANVSVDKDPQIEALLQAETQVITLVGKSSDLHVRSILETTPEENLDMIADSVRYLRDKGRRVIFDAEHFFDGYKENPDYAIKTVQAAHDAGAEYVVLCDTNGGRLPSEISEIISEVQSATKAQSRHPRSQ